MKVLFDVNIWIDIALRQRDYPKSLELFLFAVNNQWIIGLPSCGYTTIDYLISRFSSKKASKEFLTRISLDSSIEILGFGKNEIYLAQNLNIADHEDACICASAITHQYKFIATRNAEDFKKAPIQCHDPEHFLKN